MPLEINEIGIRMRVRDAKQEQDEQEDEDEDDDEEEEDDCGGPLDRARVVEECVQRVLKILKSQRGR